MEFAETFLLTDRQYYTRNWRISAMASFVYLPATAPPLRKLLPKSTPLSLSQPIQVLSIQAPRATSWKCEHCSREFKTDRGRKQHQNKCDAVTITRAITTSANQAETIIPVQPNVRPLVWGSYTLQDIELIINARRMMKSSTGAKTFSCYLQARLEKGLFVKRHVYSNYGRKIQL